MKRSAIFLDRDGTLNVDVGFTHRTDDLLLVENVCAGLRLLQQQGFGLFIVTNQSGIARGLFREADMQAFNDALRRMLADGGIEIADIYYCPYHPTAGVGRWRRDSPLRKPRPGMLLRAAEEHGLDLSGSYTIGDKKSDILAGRAAGCRTILVQTGRAGGGEPHLAAEPDYAAADLVQAAHYIEQATASATGIS